MAFRDYLLVETTNRDTYSLTEQVARIVATSGINQGLCHLFLQHTSASLILCENADPDVRTDLETILRRLAPDGHKAYRHRQEGPDDMSAHARTILTQVDLTIPVVEGQLGLGPWQCIYLYEHRTHPQRRRVIVTLWD
jgi:secondary thiamine-phosphate synthase enzyme